MPTIACGKIVGLQAGLTYVFVPWSHQGYFRIREMAAQLKEKREKESEARRKENGSGRDGSVEGGGAIRAGVESDGKEEKVGGTRLLCCVSG